MSRWYFQRLKWSETAEQVSTVWNMNINISQRPVAFILTTWWQEHSTIIKTEIYHRRCRQQFPSDRSLNKPKVVFLSKECSRNFLLSSSFFHYHHFCFLNLHMKPNIWSQIFLSWKSASWCAGGSDKERKRQHVFVTFLPESPWWYPSVLSDRRPQSSCSTCRSDLSPPCCLIFLLHLKEHKTPAPAGQLWSVSPLTQITSQTTSGNDNQCHRISAVFVSTWIQNNLLAKRFFLSFLALFKRFLLRCHIQLFSLLLRLIFQGGLQGGILCQFSCKREMSAIISFWSSCGVLVRTNLLRPCTNNVIKYTIIWFTYLTRLQELGHCGKKRTES